MMNESDKTKELVNARKALRELKGIYVSLYQSITDDKRNLDHLLTVVKESSDKNYNALLRTIDELSKRIDTVDAYLN